MTDNPTPEAAMVEPLGPLWRSVQEVHCQAMSEGCSVDQYRARMLAAIAPPPVTGGEGAEADRRRLSMARDQLTSALNMRGSGVPAGRWGWAMDHGVWLLKLAERAFATLATGGTFADGVEAAAKVVGHVASQSINDGRKWFNHPAANEALEVAANRIRALQPGAGREGGK